MKRKRLASVALLSAVSFSAWAQELDLPPPSLNDYMARGVKPPLKQRFKDQTRAPGFLKGIYITGKIGPSFATVKNISNVSTPAGGATLPPPTKSSASQTLLVGGVALGYKFLPTGIDRIEIEYMARSGLNYNASPFLNFGANANAITSSLTSTINNQTLMGKIYYDLDLDCPWIPYLQIGAGVARNSVSSNGTITIIDNTFGNISQSSSSTNSQYNFAADGGLGLSFRPTDHILLSLGYEFDYLGNNLQWTIQSFNPNGPVILESGAFYSNNIIFGLTFQS